MTTPCVECGCVECGAAGGLDHCRMLFGRLLALEFGRAAPWGPLHGLTVAIYALQHPDQFAAAGWVGRWTSVHVYVTHGPESAARMWAAARGRGLPDVADVPRVSRMSAAFTVTIRDVAGPGEDFPAVGHVDRVDRWARATHADLIGTST